LQPGDSSTSSYRKGTITQNFSPTHKSYELRTGDEGYQINFCGEFQSGQIVDYRVNDDKLYIRREDGKEYKCTIEATLTPSVGSSPAKAAPTYEKGTIEGFEVRRTLTLVVAAAGAAVRRVIQSPPGRGTPRFTNCTALT
jgi:hypothetical protein